MVQRSGYSLGELCWADVQTPDVAAAKAFYAAVFGWRYEDLPTPDGRSYAKAFLDDDLVATVAPQPQQGGAPRPAQWNVYFAAVDARAAAEEADHAGGSVQFGPEDIGDTGTLVFVEPPGGGATGIWQAGTHPGSGRHNEPGTFAWAELITPEPQAAVGFFQQLFGHEVTEYPQDDGGTYTTLMVNGAEVAGIAPAPDEDEEDGDGDAGSRGWQVYFGVSSVKEAVLSAVSAGAEVLVEPEFDDDGGTIATLKDPQGGVFSVLEL
ncbi:VOC family protein [Arthrobacter globiformis]|uniref:VOC family protein n=1 Tax=Arthrobacter globiformis TaxID=1665 RepID=UPI002787FFF7|nr:VOC family protein [Arthrobacter globiformis]MDQ0867098.1 putative enzyme related to lactoylglutathione lyase [Arthrobacter globiformis]